MHRSSLWPILRDNSLTDGPGTHTVIKKNTVVKKIIEFTPIVLTQEIPDVANGAVIKNTVVQNFTEFTPFTQDVPDVAL